MKPATKTAGEVDGRALLLGVAGYILHSLKRDMDPGWIAGNVGHDLRILFDSDTLASPRTRRYALYAQPFRLTAQRRAALVRALVLCSMIQEDHHRDKNPWSVNEVSTELRKAIGEL